MAQTHKVCSHCDVLLPVTAFRRLADGAASPLAKYCSDCQPTRAELRKTRPYEFSETVKREVLGRQQALCADCGMNLQLDGEIHYHHVIPNQSGDPTVALDSFLRTAINCVMLCKPCHDAAHDFNFRDGPVAPPRVFKNSHGGDHVDHTTWAKDLAARKPSRWL